MKPCPIFLFCASDYPSFKTPVGQMKSQKEDQSRKNDCDARRNLQQLKLGRWGNWIWISGGDGQLVSLFTTYTAVHWWYLCPSITDICYKPSIRPPAGAEFKPEKTQLEITGKFDSCDNLTVYTFLSVLLWGQILSLFSNIGKITLKNILKCNLSVRVIPVE